MEFKIGPAQHPGNRAFGIRHSTAGTRRSVTSPASDSTQYPNPGTLYHVIRSVSNICSHIFQF